MNASLQIPEDLEVGYVPTSMGGSFPGLYLASCPARFIRPVKNTSIPSDNIELIGPFEQVANLKDMVIIPTSSPIQSN